MYNPKHYTKEEKMGKGEVEEGIHMSVEQRISTIPKQVSGLLPLQNRKWLLNNFAQSVSGSQYAIAKTKGTQKAYLLLVLSHE